MSTNDVKKSKYTQAAFKEMQDELIMRKTIKRQEILDAIKVAKGFGDLSENAEYESARNEQSQNESRISELEELIRNADVVDETSIDTSLVGIGTTVTVLDQDENEEYQYIIVSKNDVDPVEHKISEESPIGKSLCGHKEGDKVEVEVPKGIIRFKILKIEHNHSEA